MANFTAFIFYGKWKALGVLERLREIGVFSYSDARVAELVDALDLGSSGVTRESSSLSFRTNYNLTVSREA